MARLFLTLDVNYQTPPSQLESYDHLLEIAAKIHAKISGLHPLDNYPGAVSVLITEARLETKPPERKIPGGIL